MVGSMSLTRRRSTVSTRHAGIGYLRFAAVAVVCTMMLGLIISTSSTPAGANPAWHVALSSNVDRGRMPPKRVVFFA